MIESTTSAAGPVHLLAGVPSPLADAIVDEFQASGVMAAMSDVESGDIVLRSSHKSSKEVRVAGYGLVRSSDANRQVSRLLSMLGRVDGLVCLVTPQHHPVRTTADAAAWDETFHRTFRWVFLLSRAVYDGWMSANGGRITYVLGEPGKPPSIGVGAVGEASVLALTRELGVELAPMVDVNAVVIGSVDVKLEPLLQDAIVKPAELGSRGADVKTIAREVVELQKSARGLHTGEITVFDAVRRHR